MSSSSALGEEKERREEREGGGREGEGRGGREERKCGQTGGSITLPFAR